MIKPSGSDQTAEVQRVVLEIQGLTLHSTDINFVFSSCNAIYTFKDASALSLTKNYDVSNSNSEQVLFEVSEYRNMLNTFNSKFCAGPTSLVFETPTVVAD